MHRLFPALLYDAVTHNPVLTLPTTDPSKLGPTYFPINLLPESALKKVFSVPLGSEVNTLAFFPQLPPLIGKTAAAVFLMAVFGARALYTHWLTATGGTSGKRVHPTTVANAKRGGWKVKAS